MKKKIGAMFEGSLEKTFNDLAPFEHGHEGTHHFCLKHARSMECCACLGKTDCSDATNFVQPGETTACGHCEPEKYTAVLPCECNCHKTSLPKKEGWERPLENLLYDYGNHCVRADMKKDKDSVTKEGETIKEIKAYVSSLLVSQKEGILAMIEEQRMVWPKMGQEYTLNALKAKIELI